MKKNNIIYNKKNNKIYNKYNYQLYLVLKKIKNINKHLLFNKKDYNSKKFLFIYINKKKKIISYFKKKKKI
ncbi:MAG: 30S ribosomal protein S15 [Candidatus Shikimatogenerans sp. Tser]|uniref:30S ribosomal protein S15 n=1 Tax=Candidatus Shikimatogenerans sp. Tser TaxID=3158568 RepID=A0AAU7QQE9_9FLAO